MTAGTDASPGSHLPGDAAAAPARAGAVLREEPMVGEGRIGKSAARRCAFVFAAVALAFVPSPVSGQDAPRATSLWRFAGPEARARARGVEAARPRRRVIVNAGLLGQQGRLSLLLPGGDSLVAVRSS